MPKSYLLQSIYTGWKNCWAWTRIIKISSENYIVNCEAAQENKNKIPYLYIYITCNWTFSVVAIKSTYCCGVFFLRRSEESK